MIGRNKLSKLIFFPTNFSKYTVGMLRQTKLSYVRVVSVSPFILSLLLIYLVALAEAINSLAVMRENTKAKPEK